MGGTMMVGISLLLSFWLLLCLPWANVRNQGMQREELSTKRSDIRVEVVREGRRQPISIFEVVVGDIVCLKISDQIPADRLFLEGHSLMVDGSSMITGGRSRVEIHEKRNRFLLSGTKVMSNY
jgi:Ca2+-transporting ATPase